MTREDEDEREARRIESLPTLTPRALQRVGEKRALKELAFGVGQAMRAALLERDEQIKALQQRVDALERALGEGEAKRATLRIA
jgi:hypothetical protein